MFTALLSLILLAHPQPSFAKGDARKAVMQKALEDLRKEKIEERAPKVGEALPNFSLPKAGGGTVRLSEARKKGPVVVTFFRGSWCPYCVAQLKEASLRVKELNGAAIFAISPEEPGLSEKFAKEKGIAFPILFDKDNAYAEKLKIVFGLPEDLKAVYKEFGIDLKKSQGNERWRLPVPVTYVVDVSGVIRYRFLDVDYKKRADFSALAEAVKSARP